MHVIIKIVISSIEISAAVYSPDIRKIDAVKTALDGKMITADALHCQRTHAATVVEKGGDYLLQIKANQENLLKKAQALDRLKDTPFLTKPEQDTAA